MLPSNEWKSFEQQKSLCIGKKLNYSKINHMENSVKFKKIYDYSTNTVNSYTYQKMKPKIYLFYHHGQHQLGNSNLTNFFKFSLCIYA